MKRSKSIYNRYSQEEKFERVKDAVERMKKRGEISAIVLYEELQMENLFINQGMVLN